MLNLKQAIKKILPESLLYKIQNDRRARVQRKELSRWEQNPKAQGLPHLLKRQVVQEYAEKFKLATFVETGSIT